ncbi:MAG: peptidase family nonpeptidase [Acidobacteriaceae bacterium]|nr:peptidase family nonpeptidase [Acidobacteriaceae bacterium]
MKSHSILAAPVPAPVLAIDTCGQVGTVALTSITSGTEAVTCIAQAEMGSRSASAQLMPAIDAMLRDARLNLADLRALILVNGPGSFTGLRVGLSTAKGLAHASGIPIFAISRLAVLSSLSEDPRSVALLDAGRNELYARQGEREWLASFEEIASLGERGASFAVAEASLADRLAAWRSALVGGLDAFAAVGAVLPRLFTGEADDLASLDANYMRRSDAELFARPAAQT